MTVVDLLALATMPTDVLRRLANSHIGDPNIQHAVDVELLQRERHDELTAFQARIAHAGAAEVHAAEDIWCCLRGPLAESHRAILRQAEARLQIAHELAGGAA